MTASNAETTMPAAAVQLSVIIPVGDRSSDIETLYNDYKAGVAALGRSYEFIVVLDGPRPAVAEGLQRLIQQGERITVVAMTRSFGEATALMVGFEQACGEVLITLPSYFQVEGSQISKLVAALDSADLAIGRRWPRAGNWLERLRRGAFHKLLAVVTRLQFNDLGCGARAMKRIVAEEIHLYGDQHRFLAVLADRQGFRVREVDLQQSPQDRYPTLYSPREYTRGFLDIFTVFFLVRFTKKPLRFFGMIGITTFGVGALLLTMVVVQRLFFGRALADRPALLLTSLLVVLGLQLFALGLLGELIIFTHARNIKDYKIDKVIQFQGPSRELPPPSKGSGQATTAAAQQF